MKLSENFDSSEFNCHCCGKAKINRDLVLLLQAIRDKLGKSISIISGYRCEKHNKAVGGAKHSQHVLGNAADIRIAGMNPSEVYDYLETHFRNECQGLGQYDTFTHLDIRTTGLARWKG